MPAEMTSDYHEQSALLTWRMVFLGVAILVSGALAPGIASAVGGVAGYRVMGLVMAAVLAVSMVATFAGTRKAPQGGRGAHGQAEPSLRAQLAVIRANRTFRLLLWFSCAQMLAAGLMLAAAPYFATYILHDPNAVTPLFVCLVGPILVTMPPWKGISRRVEKRGAMVAPPHCSSSARPRLWPRRCSAHHSLTPVSWSSASDMPGSRCCRAGRQAEARRTSSVPKTVHLGPRSAPLTSETSSFTIRAPISSIGWRMVVSCGIVCRASGESSKPTTATSSGTLRPVRCRARSTPAAIRSEAAKTASMSGRLSSSRYSACSPETWLKSP